MQMIKTEPPVEVTIMSVSGVSATNVQDEVWMKTGIEEQAKAGVTMLNKKNLLQKPHLSYIALISRAIQSHPDKKMLLSDIYEWIVNNFPSFKMVNRSWRNSVRHNLSLNECFIKCGRCDSGKGHYWGIHTANQDDFAKGDYRRRHARRLVKKCDELAKLFESDSANEVPRYPSVPVTSQYGYVRMTCMTVSSSYLIATFGEEVLSTERRPCRVSKDCIEERSHENGRMYDGYTRSVRHYNNGVSSMSENNQQC